ncbi:Uncharacterized protein Pd630_LPD16187 (plasmid) [Rhodococcus opacus PD630]|nr:Uncharacterized protein Pd630_LPD16187 [Rhodococcus opacus PD630]
MAISTAETADMNDTEPEKAPHEPDTDRAPEGRRPSEGTRKRRGAAAVTVASLLVTTVVLCLGGALLWQHRAAETNAARTAAILDAARSGVESMISITDTSAADDVQRVLDQSTGTFRSDFEARSQSFVTVVQEAKVTTNGSVTAVGVESESPGSAVVLVAAQSSVSNSAGAENETRSWRLRVTMTEDAGTYKMANVEFVA